MALPESKSYLKHFRASDLRGMIRLITQATTGVTRISEGVHQSVWRTIGFSGGPSPEQTRGLTRLVYQTIYHISQQVGRGLELGLESIEPLAISLDHMPETPQRAAVIAALNGVIGDHLASSNNPLATAMSFRNHKGQILDLRTLSSSYKKTDKLVLFIHGLCMNNFQWQPLSNRTADLSLKSPGHVSTLEKTLGYKPIYLRYNTGLSVAENGRLLASKLQQLLDLWPNLSCELSVIAHSMGGLVIRSACYYAEQQKLSWLDSLNHVVCLGTPHHGAPLEQAGHWIDLILGSNFYSRPFAALGQLRSAGINDLRCGRLSDDGGSMQTPLPDKLNYHSVTPLPDIAQWHTAATTTSKRRSPIANHLLGDGLVPLKSALGEHNDPKRKLCFKPSSQWIGYEINHMELLYHPAVTQQLLKWMKQ